MRDVNEVLAEKQKELEKVKLEIESLKHVIEMLGPEEKEKKKRWP